MHIERMRLFAEVVKQGSFTKAADSLGVSKGYLSTQVKLLESELQKQLLVRNTRNMRLTSAGTAVFSNAEQLRSLWANTQALVSQQEDSFKGIVKCTAPVGLSKYLLWPMFNQLMQQHSEIKLLLTSGNLTHNLLTDDFDFAIRLTNTPPDDMVAIKLSDVNYICCASPEYLSENGSPKTPEQLNQYSTLALNHWHFWSFEHQQQHLKIDLNAQLLVSDNDILKAAALNHQGITRLPHYMIESELENGSLTPVLTDYQGETRAIYLLYPQLTGRPARVKYCLDFIREQFN